MITSAEKNPEIDQDRAFDLLDTFEKHGCIMFAQQKSIYYHLSRVIAGSTVLEAGCGSGVGTSILSRVATQIIGTDKLARNVAFARCLYPWLSFEVWDINKSSDLKFQVVVCVEAIEHVTNPKDAIQNLVNAAIETVWISTPNGAGKPRPPENHYHVCEYTPHEMLDMIGDHPVIIRNGENWERVFVDTEADPLVYRIEVCHDST